MITETQLQSMRLAENATSSDPYILKKLIEEHNTTSMRQGVDYYNNDNAIRNRKIFAYDADGRKFEDDEAINNRIPHNWHKLLVDQKVSYLLGKPIVLTAEPERLSEEVNGFLDEDFDDVLQEIGKGSSNKGTEYLHPFINSQGKFDYIVVSALQGIPIYDTDYEQEMVAFIRYYPYWVNGKETIRAEWWTADDVTYYIKQPSGMYVLDDSVDNPANHFSVGEEGKGWGKVPFIEFRNNEEKYSDLRFYKEIVDAYDLIIANRANTIEDIQKAFYVLKGYDGTSLSEFNANLRRYRAAKVSGDGGIDIEQGDVPVEAEDSTLDRMEENIFLFGQGVNIKTDKFGQSPSGVALKFLFHLLDLKANIMARKFAKAIKEFVWFLIEYLRITDKFSAPQDALDSVRVTFNKAMPVNELEMVQMAQMSKGLISDETIVSNHVWVEDANYEKEQMEQEQEGRVDLDGPVIDDEPTE